MSKQKELDFEIKKDYLELPTRQLLEEYGAGSHIPGSGSASALSALIAIGMMQTVCKLTISKPKYVKQHKDFEYILNQLEKEYKPKIMELFKQDIVVFNLVSQHRFARDNSEDKKERQTHSRNALEQQKKATEIPIQICELCMEMLPLAMVIFDNGFKSARGDSGVAISNLLSAISGSLFIIFLNLKSYNKSKWLTATKQKAETLARSFNQSQNNAFRKVLELYEEGLLDEEKQLHFEFVTQETQS